VHPSTASSSNGRSLGGRSTRPGNQTAGGGSGARAREVPSPGAPGGRTLDGRTTGGRATTPSSVRISPQPPSCTLQ
jgi:hypothetical protein